MLAKFSFSLLVVFLAVSIRISPQDRNDAHWIDGVKNTPVGQIDAGLPEESVSRWFTNLVGSNETDYEVRECADAPAADGSQQRLLCVIAYTKPPHPGWRRLIELWFVVAAVASSEGASNRPEPTPVALRLLWACEGPSNPKMRRPTRCFSKLSDLEKLVRGSTTH